MIKSQLSKLGKVRLFIPFIALALVSACSYTDFGANLTNYTAQTAPNRSDDALVATDLGIAPEFTNTVWLNTDKPLHLSELHGQVVLIEFWTFGCINCYHTLSTMRDFYARYQGKKFQIVTFHFPEFSYEHDVNNVKDFLAKEDIKYPVAIDNDGVAWNNYEMHAWPAFIIVDKQGHMRYRQIGEGRYGSIEEAINALLSE